MARTETPPVDWRGALTKRIVSFLTEPLSGYEQRGWNDRAELLRHVKKGDVLLVEGDSRVASIIKYLTQSSWSHAALYVGDEVTKQGGEVAERLRARFGPEADHLLVEALPEGVVASPISKYVDFNIRLVRAHALRPEHLRQILDESVRSIGWHYDLRNVLDLMRYMLPVRIVPDRFRRTALHFGSGMPTEVICSSLLGRVFHRVGFPILPAIEYPEGFDAEERPVSGGRQLLRRIFGHESGSYTGIFHMRHPTLLTPRDFDLSPYFEIVKFNVVAGGRFDYQRIRWADEDLAEAQAEPLVAGATGHPRPYGAEPAGVPPIPIRADDVEDPAGGEGAGPESLADDGASGPVRAATRRGPTAAPPRRGMLGRRWSGR